MRAIKLVAMLLAALMMLALVGCDSTPSEPEDVTSAKAVLDEAWAKTGSAGQALMFECAAYTPGLPYITEKADQLLASGVGNQRETGVRLLAEWSNPSDVERLAGFLGDSVPLVALQAAKGLAAMGDSRGVELLSENLRTRDELLNPEICGLLAKVGSDACYEDAKKELTGKDAPKSEAAAAVLGEMATDDAIETLRSALGILRGERRAPVITALGQASSDPKDAVRVARYLKYTENVLASLGALGDIGGEEAEKKLREILSKKDRRAGVAAAGALAKLGQYDAEIADAFERALADESTAIRFEAASYLAEAKISPEILALLNKAVADEEPKVVRAALNGLRGNATAESMPVLSAAFDKFNGAREGAGYDAALQTVVVVSKVPGPDADAFLKAAVDNLNWGHAMQASLGILERWEQTRAQTE